MAKQAVPCFAKTEKNLPVSKYPPVAMIVA